MEKLNRVNKVIINALNKIHPKAPTFVFLDPSAGHLNLDTIRTLAQWKTELFINFPLHMDLQRNMPNDPSKLRDHHIRKLNGVFGPGQWQSIYEAKLSGERRYTTRRLIDLYMDALKEAGYTYNMFSDLIRNDTGQPLYYMIWVGKQDVGKTIMHYVLKQQFQSQLTLFPYID